MPSTSIDVPGSAMAEYEVAKGLKDEEDREKSLHEEARLEPTLTYDGAAKQTDYTHRKLRPRHIQLIGIGGTIGTALYVQIGRGLINGGPGSLFIAFTIWCTFVLATTNCMAEMVTYNPISSPFIRFAGRYVDEAFGVAAGYNFFIFEAALVPFEVVACNVIINYWTNQIPVAAICAIVIIGYAVINLLAVKFYGESEFWLALGKVILIIGLIIFTFIAMLGGNPINDRYGFRYWRDPGAFAEYWASGDLGRFMGFMVCLIQASFTIAGPEYVSMSAGEAENPQSVMPRAFKAVAWRLTVFFVLGSLAVGINVPYTDQTLRNAFQNNLPGAAASPYVVAMDRLRISVLPHIVNALVLASAFSAGNSYVYCASRSLFGLALEGKAPKFLTICTKQGVPIYCVAAVLLIALLSFLQVSSGAAVVLQWFVNLVTASQLINFSVMSYTFLKWKKACEAQGLDRNSLHYRSWWQPYQAYYALVGTTVMAFVGGYEVFLPAKYGNDNSWDVATFFFSYAMIGVFPLIFVVWKLVKKTKWLKPHEVILRTSEVEEIELYTKNYIERPPKTIAHKWIDKLFG